MNMELVIDGKKKVFTTPFIKMMARRKYLEFESNPDFDLNNLTPAQFDEYFQTILVDIVFEKQFTLEQLYNGASFDYISDKMFEAIWGIPRPKIEETETDPNSLPKSEEKS